MCFEDCVCVVLVLVTRTVNAEREEGGKEIENR